MCYGVPIRVKPMDIKEFSNDSYVSGGDVCMLFPPFFVWGAILRRQAEATVCLRIRTHLRKPELYQLDAAS